jgi:hypothetical protein
MGMAYIIRAREGTGYDTKHAARLQRGRVCFHSSKIVFTRNAQGGWLPMWKNIIGRSFLLLLVPHLVNLSLPETNIMVSLLSAAYACPIIS